MLKSFWFIVSVFGYFHEIFHYIPAKLFGLNPIIQNYQVDWEEGEVYQNVIVTTGPIIFGLFMLPLSIKLHYFSQSSNLLTESFVIFSIGWFWVCYYDFKDFFDILIEMKRAGEVSADDTHLLD